MEELFELTGHYNLTLSFNEDEREIYASSKTATSVLVEDLQRLKEITGAEKAELHADNNTEEDNFILTLELPKKSDQNISEEVMECPYCGKEYEMESFYKQHVQECDGDGLK